MAGQTPLGPGDAAPYTPPAMPDTASLYDRDWYAWTQDQAARLRAWPEQLRPNGLDVELTLGNTGGVFEQNTAQVLQQNCAEAGVEASGSASSASNVTYVMRMGSPMR